MTFTITLPPAVTDLLNRLQSAGYAAYAVGGCVRDSFLGLTPHDWDLCTSALPEQIQEVFRSFQNPGNRWKGLPYPD